MASVEDRWRKLQAWERRMEDRRLRGVHRWDYERPCNLWESWPWWFRWPVAAALMVYFGGALLIPFL